MLLAGISLVNIVCLVTGGALSFFVERWLRLREQEEPEPEPEVHEERRSDLRKHPMTKEETASQRVA